MATLWHKHSNGRLVPRRANGRFRKTTIQDLGVAGVIGCECGRCIVGKRAEQTGPFIDPFLFNKVIYPEHCPSCGKEVTQGKVEEE
jgi:hypothetical protein